VGGVRADIDVESYPADRSPRPDVAAAFNKPAYENAGFTICIPVSSLSKGTHYLSLKLLSKNRKYYYQTEHQVLEIPNR
jgi:hypothetical protein